VYGTFESECDRVMIVVAGNDVLDDLLFHLPFYTFSDSQRLCQDITRTCRYRH
jgi:hypothetical protein